VGRKIWSRMYVPLSVNGLGRGRAPVEIVEKLLYSTTWKLELSVSLSTLSSQINSKDFPWRLYTLYPVGGGSQSELLVGLGIASCRATTCRAITDSNPSTIHSDTESC
jgi:hypothetical protein